MDNKPNITKTWDALTKDERKRYLLEGDDKETFTGKDGGGDGPLPGSPVHKAALALADFVGDEILLSVFFDELAEQGLQGESQKVIELAIEIRNNRIRSNEQALNDAAVQNRK